MPTLTVNDLAAVVYSSGKVFDGLSTGRLDTENFLRSGSLEGITSRSDLSLLQDLRDVAQFIVDHADRKLSADYVRAVNGKITRSGALHPGELRTDTQGIGVNTPHGRHTPSSVTESELEQIVRAAARQNVPLDGALRMFVDLATAQPFEDGNKRTALFAANGLLLNRRSGHLLSIPVDDVTRFNDLLARAYIFNERDGITDLLRSAGVIERPDLAETPLNKLGG